MRAVVATRRLVGLTVVLFLAGCTTGASPTPSPELTSTASSGSGGNAGPALTGPNPTTDTTGHAQVTVRADTSGVSDGFTVNTGGTFDIQYVIDKGNDSGCGFLLNLTHSKDGPIIQSTSPAFAPGGVETRGSVTWTISPGSYVLQEDETGPASCFRGFSATVTGPR